MAEIDLDDLPGPLRAALELALAGETVDLIREGRTVGRLAAVEAPETPADDSFARLAPEEQVAEVLGEFEAAMNDEF